jgi:hypothetical protein
MTREMAKASVRITPIQTPLPLMQTLLPLAQTLPLMQTPLQIVPAAIAGS